MGDLSDIMLYLQYYFVECGQLVIGSYDGNLCLCDWTSSKSNRTKIDFLIRSLNDKTIWDEDDIIKDVISQLDEYFVGKRKNFDIPTLVIGTDFQKIVWDALKGVEYGETISYLELTKRIGKPKAVRAVANAVGANPISIILPCHRIVGSNNALGGYSGGLDIKRHLLDLEFNNSDFMKL